MIRTNDNGVKYCDVCNSYHSFLNLDENGECNYCKRINNNKVMEESKTHCLRDYKNHHCWQSIGVITRANGQIAQVFKCSQCDKIILENLEEITRVYQ